MFKCDRCTTVTPPRTKLYRVVAEREDVSYAFRRHANRWKKAGTTEVSDDPGGTGWQIVREEKLCPECWYEDANAYH